MSNVGTFTMTELSDTLLRTGSYRPMFPFYERRSLGVCVLRPRERRCKESRQEWSILRSTGVSFSRSVVWEPDRKVRRDKVRRVRGEKKGTLTRYFICWTYVRETDEKPLESGSVVLFIP